MPQSDDPRQRQPNTEGHDVNKPEEADSSIDATDVGDDTLGENLMDHSERREHTESTGEDFQRDETEHTPGSPKWSGLDGGFGR